MVWFHDGVFEAELASKWQQRHPDGRFYPNFISLGPTHHVYEREGWFFAIHRSHIREFLYSPNPFAGEMFHREPDLSRLLGWIKEQATSR